MKRWVFLFALSLLFSSPQSAYPAEAFDDEESPFDYRTLLRISIWESVNPDLPVKIYQNRESRGSYVVGRFIGEYVSDSVMADINIVGVMSSFSASTLIVNSEFIDVERSSALTIEGRTDSAASSQMEVDHISGTLYFGPTDITIGRQPINMATCYYFTPNDFFAPFGAQTFYRAYKPGVDAARLEISLGDLSQLTLVAVLGYTPTIGESVTGWSEEPDSDRTSYLARYSVVLVNFDISVLGGRLASDSVLGGALQGELPWGLGLRAEGHYRWPGELASAADEERAEVTLQIGKRFESSLDIKVEYFYHGAGADRAADYYPGASGIYFANEYLAIGASYQVSPLLIGQGLVLLNLVDNSQSYSIYAVLSVADESDLSFSLSVPVGETEPELSEFGAYPASFSVEISSYF